jgi:ubiquinone/menaquinone biosynthesis C-methylase UbiE
MQDRQHIIHCYDKTAKTYADKFMDELSYKHLDRILLSSFVTENIHSGKWIDLGCGPGQTTKYVSDCGVKNLYGTDLSPVMIETAKQLNPHLHFETADMLNLHYADQTFAAAIAFYAIVHFNTEQLEKALEEIKRVLIPGGQLLFSFHTGDQVVHLDQFLEQEVNIDFYFFDTLKVIDLLQKNGFEIIDALERQPYNEIEYPSKRAYIWVKRL